MVDSGCSRSTCPPGYAGRIVPSKPVQLYTAGGDAVAHYGKAEIDYLMADNKEVCVQFQVADISRPLLSVSGFNDSGRTVVFGPEGAYITAVPVSEPPSDAMYLERHGHTHIGCGADVQR